MTSACRVEDLEGLALGELPPETAAAVEAHAARCQTCGPELAWLRQERRLVDERGAGVKANSDALWTQIARRVEQDAPGRRPRWWWVAGISVGAAAIAAAWLFWMRPLHVSGEATARERLEVRLGRRGVAVLEPGSHIQFVAHEAKQDIGDVFYRINEGGRFAVETPHGRIRVTGTCFTVRVRRGPSADERFTQVVLYEGTVRFERGSESLDLAAGEEAIATELGIRRTSTVQMFPNSATDDSVDRQLRSRIAELEAKISALSVNKVVNAQSGGKDDRQPQGLRSQPLDWDEIAGGKSRLEIRLPCEKPNYSAEKLKQLGLTAEDEAPLNEAYARVQAEIWREIRPACSQVIGENAQLERLGVALCLPIMQAELGKAPDKRGILAAVANINAGRKPMPRPDDSSVDPLIRILATVSGAEKRLQNELTGTYGPEQALRIAYAAHICASSGPF